MQITETQSDGLKHAFTIVLPAADLQQKRQAKLDELGRTMRMPGFRPGKVPMTVLRKRYGNAVAAEVADESMNEATRQLLSERGLRPATQPKVDFVSDMMAEANDLEFKLELEVLPDITIPDLSQINLTRLKTEPNDPTCRPDP